MKLNPEQEAVASARGGVYAAIAGPGSGKTTSMIERYCRLIEEGVDQADIWSVTFTSEAAKNMRARIEKRGIDVQKTDRVSGFSTFHSAALQFAVEEHEHFPFQLAAFPLATEGQTYKIMGEVGRKHEIHPRDLRPWVSLQKRNRVRPAEALAAAEKAGTNQAKALAYKAYEAKLREIGALDFDGLLLEMVGVLETKADVRARYQYRFIQTDEAQDCDSLQWRLLQLLTEKHRNLLAVGDAGQSVYSFRGASPDLFLNMQQFFPDVRTLYLGTNHRSTQKIVDFLREIGPVKELAEKFTTNNELGVEPTITQYPTEVHEATAVARRVEDDPNSWAVLARTNRALRPIEDALSEAGIKYYVLGNSGFWSRPEIVSVLAYCACAAGNANDNAVLTALRAPFEPSRYLKKKQIADGLKDLQKRDPAKPSIMSLLYNHTESGARGFGRALWNMKRLRDMTASYAVKEVLKEIKALAYYQDEESAEADNSPVENLLELGKIAERFSSLHDLLAHARRAQAASRNRKGVSLATCHAFKGREAPCVSVIGCSEGLMPHAKAENLAEEANIFFVACSRPEQTLHISYVGQPSRFLAPFLPKVTEENPTENTRMFSGEKASITAT
jgi:DNA helicase-2/ATP-dependent DNA helicase PcrA